MQKYSRNGLVSKNFVFSFQSGYIFNKLFHFWLINVRLAGKETDFFYHVYVFFFSWRRADFIVLARKKCCRDPASKRHQTTHGDFSRETSDRFHALNFYFLFENSFFSRLLAWTTQGLDDVFVSRAYDRPETPCQLAGKRFSIFSKLFFTRNSKMLGSGRVLELFVHTEMAQYLNFICFAFFF